MVYEPGHLSTAKSIVVIYERFHRYLPIEQLLKASLQRMSICYLESDLSVCPFCPSSFLHVRLTMCLKIKEKLGNGEIRLLPLRVNVEAMRTEAERRVEEITSM